MKDCDKEFFIGAFNDWYMKYEKFINERSSPNEKEKIHYLHKKLRSAYLSLKRNMPYFGFGMIILNKYTSNEQWNRRSFY